MTATTPAAERGERKLIPPQGGSSTAPPRSVADGAPIVGPAYPSWSERERVLVSTSLLAGLVTGNATGAIGPGADRLVSSAVQLADRLMAKLKADANGAVVPPTQTHTAIDVTLSVKEVCLLFYVRTQVDGLLPRWTLVHGLDDADRAVATRSLMGHGLIAYASDGEAIELTTLGKNWLRTAR